MRATSYGTNKAKYAKFYNNKRESSKKLSLSLDIKN